MSVNAETFGALKRSAFGSPEHRLRSVKDELRANLLTRLATRRPIFNGVVGYEETVMPQIVNALLSRHNFILLGLRGQAKSRILRALTSLLDPALPIIAGSEVNDNPFAPISKFGKNLLKEAGDDTPIVQGSALKALEGDAAWEPKIDELMQAVDDFIPTPAREMDKPFLMPVEDIFTIQGRGTVATGRIERGKININEPVEIVGIKDTRNSVVTGVEMFKKLLDSGMAGDNVGLLLRGVERKEIERGQVIAKPGSITPHTKFKAEAYVLTKEEGGRHTPFFTGYRPQFYFRTTDVTGVAHLPTGVEMVMPGDNIQMEIELIAPIAMEKGLRFAIREGGRTVGAGTVSEVVL